eukprot:scaffold84071_cov51-Phaeocystis_antarctica.AAC.1
MTTTARNYSKAWRRGRVSDLYGGFKIRSRFGDSGLEVSDNTVVEGEARGRTYESNLRVHDETTWIVVGTGVWMAFTTQRRPLGGGTGLGRAGGVCVVSIDGEN